MPMPVPLTIIATATRLTARARALENEARAYRADANRQLAGSVVRTASLGHALRCEAAARAYRGDMFQLAETIGADDLGGGTQYAS